MVRLVYISAGIPSNDPHDLPNFILERPRRNWDWDCVSGTVSDNCSICGLGYPYPYSGSVIENIYARNELILCRHRRRKCFTFKNWSKTVLFLIEY